MQSLETLLGVLGITQHMEALSNWRDALLVGKAAELKDLHAAHAAQLSTLTAEQAALKAADQAIKNQELNDRDTVATIALIVAETSKPVAQREIEALQAERSRLEAERARLEAEIAAKIAAANA